MMRVVLIVGAVLPVLTGCAQVGASNQQTAAAPAIRAGQPNRPDQPVYNGAERVYPDETPHNLGGQTYYYNPQIPFPIH